ncbi:transcriptional repressor [Lutibacter sp.]|uniref:Fur family transcriptional regulator n=1 Tax=Lutibacter sp. TaxID=1925666 RepID=UPI0025C584AF|nr:transcriptional repressor [Lutibacter sp.]MCF6169325.1 transcriptional repressor [Lutibacter sp.]
MNLDLEKILDKHNVKPTAMRLLVLQFLLTEKAAMSLTDLENYFDKSDRTTLYRTLKTFVKYEIAHKIDDGTGVTKYALCEENCHCEIETDLHVHFHCKLCKQTICLPKHKIPYIKLPDGFIADDVSLIVTGMCNKCNK